MYKVAENIQNSENASSGGFIAHFFSQREKLKYVVNLSRNFVESELKKLEIFTLFTRLDTSWDYHDFSVCQDSGKFYIYIGQIAMSKTLISRGFTKEPLLKVNILIQSYRNEEGELCWNRIDTWNSTITDEKSEIVVLEGNIYKLTVKTESGVSLALEAYNVELKRWFKKLIKLDLEDQIDKCKLSCTKIDGNSIAISYGKTVWSLNILNWNLKKITECNENITALETRQNTLNILTENNIYLVFIKLPRLSEIAQSVILSIK